MCPRKHLCCVVSFFCSSSIIKFMFYEFVCVFACVFFGCGVLSSQSHCDIVMHCELLPLCSCTLCFERKTLSTSILSSEIKSSVGLSPFYFCTMGQTDHNSHKNYSSVPMPKISVCISNLYNKTGRPSIETVLPGKIL